jgi:DNA helicase-2/ATP-dependent DNA helicase PcrA
MTLNTAQQKAINGCGIQLILAGPGSGKTRVITEKILHLLDSGVLPREILALTFSEKAAKEMSDRIEQKRPYLDLDIHTFHSFCLDVLQDNVLVSGMSVSSGVISRTNQLVWGLRNIDNFGFEYIRLGNNAAEIIESIIDGISAFRDELISPEILAQYLANKQFEQVDEDEKVYLGMLSDLLKVYRAYTEYKFSENLIDFDDMIHGVVNLLRTNGMVKSAYRRRYKYILVDEFQDTNFAQLELLKELAGENLCVVGDDDQTIYRFRGAYLTNMQDFKQWYAGHAETLLDRNYRNSKNILSIAQQLMQTAPNRLQKELFTEKPDGEPVRIAVCGNESAEGEFVAQEIGKLVGSFFYSRNEGKERAYEYSDIAVLCRTRADGLKFYQSLRRHNIPCVFKGDVDFLSLPVIRDMIAYLNIINNPLTAGIPLNRIMKVCAVPETTVRKINAYASKNMDETTGSDGVYEAMEKAIEIVPEHAGQIAEILSMLHHFIEHKERHSLSELVYEVMLQASGLYRSALDADAGRNRTFLNKFVEITDEYNRITRNATIENFLEYLQYFSAFEIDVEDKDVGNTVQILTVHKSKGKEFPAVFVVDLASNRFPLKYRRKKFTVPSDLAKGLKTGDDEKALFLQEERRLLYVAMSRAEERLYLMYSEWYGENKLPSRPSQFLFEIAYESNPLISVIRVPAVEAQIPVRDTTPIEDLKVSLQEQAIRAVSEMRIGAALQNLVTLERVRQKDENGLDDVDPSALIAKIDTSTRVEDLLPENQPSLIPEDLTFSATALQLYEDCPLKYKFSYLYKIPTKPTPAMSMGSALHSVIENLTQSPDPLLNPNEQALALLEQFWRPDVFATHTEEKEARESAYDRLNAYLKWQEKNNNKVIGVEKEFFVPFENRILHGYIDRIEQTPDGKYVVVDFKSGTKPSDLSGKTIGQNIQLNLYCLAVQQLFGTLPRQAVLFYLKDNKQIPYTPTPESIEAFTERLSALIAGILNEEFPAKPGYIQCRWCAYYDLCEHKENGGA